MNLSKFPSDFIIDNIPDKSPLKKLMGGITSRCGDRYSWRVRDHKFYTWDAAGGHKTFKMPRIDHDLFCAMVGVDPKPAPTGFTEEYTVDTQSWTKQYGSNQEDRIVLKDVCKEFRHKIHKLNGHKVRVTVEVLD